MGNELFEFDRSLSACMGILRRIDEQDKKARAAKLQKALQRESDLICRELGIKPKKGVIVRRAECRGTLRVVER